MTEIIRRQVPGQLAPISHYCHVVRADKLIWISGTVGVREDGSIPEDTVEQFRVAMDNLDICLREVGGEPRHIVKVNVYLTDVDDRARINPIRVDYFGPHVPASTLVEVSALVLPELKVEIEAQAVVD